MSATEGLNGFDPNGSANPGDGNSSFGPFQLHYGGVAPGGNAVGGMGDDFTAATKLDARDPSTWKQQVDFALDHAAQNGWGAWHGAQKARIGNWAGIGDAGQTPAGGQGSAPAGSSAPLISFGGPASSAPTSGGSGDTPASPAGPAPVSDDMYATAKRVVGHFENSDPRTMTLDQQRAVTRSTELISQYEAAQGGDASPGTADGRPTSAASATPSTGQHPFFPPPSPQAGGAPAPGGLPTVTVGAQPGRQPPQAGGAPAMAPGGVQPISFGGGAPQAAPAAGGAPAGLQAAPAAPAGTVGAMPPEVAAALTRLQNRQGSPADAQLWGAYQRNAAQGVTAAPGGGQGAAAPGRPVPPPQVGQGSTPNGPDLPNLPAGYQDPGGGTRYVNDVLGKAQQFAAAGDPRAKIWEARANQIQTQLTAAQGFKNNLALAQARADDRYNAANSPGAIAAAGQRAGAETTARNALSSCPPSSPTARRS